MGADIVEKVARIATCALPLREIDANQDVAILAFAGSKKLAIVLESARGLCILFLRMPQTLSARSRRHFSK
jgi:hypothetical protein